MKLSECKDWKAIHFATRTILKKDLGILSADARQAILEQKVEPMKGRKGHYRAI